MSCHGKRIEWKHEALVVNNALIIMLNIIMINLTSLLKTRGNCIQMKSKILLTVHSVPPHCLLLVL